MYFYTKSSQMFIIICAPVSVTIIVSVCLLEDWCVIAVGGKYVFGRLFCIICIAVVFFPFVDIGDGCCDCVIRSRVVSVLKIRYLKVTLSSCLSGFIRCKFV